MNNPKTLKSKNAIYSILLLISFVFVACTKRIEIKETAAVPANTASNARNIVGKSFSEMDFKDDKPIREETVESRTNESSQTAANAKASVTNQASPTASANEPAKVIYYQSGASVQVKDGVIVAHMRDAVSPTSNSGIPEPSVDESSIQYWRHKFKGEEVEDIKRTDMCDVHQHCTSELKTKNGQSIFYSPETGYVERIFEYAKEQ